MDRKAKQKGFTMIELIIAVSISLVIFSAVVFSPTKAIGKSKLDGDKAGCLRIIRNAQASALSGKNNSAFGAYLDVNDKKCIAYQGSSYDRRSAEYDQVYFLDGKTNMSLEISPDINFSAGLIAYETAGRIVFSRQDEVQEIILNGYGVPY